MNHHPVVVKTGNKQPRQRTGRNDGAVALTAGITQCLVLLLVLIEKIKCCSVIGICQRAR